MSIKLHFTEHDWERVRRDWAAWWAGELERPLVTLEGWDPACAADPPKAPVFVAAFSFDTPAAQVVDCYQAQFEARRYYGDAMPHWFPNFGPAAGAALLGAAGRPVLDTVWFEPLDVAHLSELHPAYDEQNLWWRRVREVIGLAAQRWGAGNLAISATDLGGTLDILAHLRTPDRLLLDLYDEPEEMERLAREITRLWLRFFHEQCDLTEAPGGWSANWAKMIAPGRSYMMQCDFAYMISPRMFERYVLPDLAACCDEMDYAFYHLDGPAQIAHLDMLLSLERLRGIQWVPGAGAPPAEEWLPLLQRIRAAGKLCQPGWISARGALRIVRELGGRGFHFWVTDRFTPEEAEDFLRLLHSENGS